MSLLVRSLSVTYSDHHCVGAHAHPWGQLVYADRGAIIVTSKDGEWLVPPARAVWLPPGADHRLKMRGATTLRSLYLAPEVSAPLNSDCHGLEVIPLLRELVLHIVRVAPLDDEHGTSASLIQLLVHLLAEARGLPFRLNLPTDLRARRVCDLVRQDIAAELSLQTLAARSGASARTLQRVFISETGLHFSEWRRTARLLHATALLLDGVSVTEAGLACGYGSTSAFISAFRRRTGQTPLTFRRGF